MKKYYILLMALFVVLAMSSCNKGKSHESSDTDDPETELTDTDFDDDEDTGRDVADLPERADYTFSTKVIADEEDVARKIIVTMKNSKFDESFESEIDAVTLDTVFWHGFGHIREDDINFDGYPDLMVCCGPFNSYGNFTYGAWLWNQKLHDFVFVKGFDELFDPEFNKKDKTISSSFRMDDHEDDAVYKWNGNELELVSSETIIYSELENE